MLAWVATIGRMSGNSFPGSPRRAEASDPDGLTLLTLLPGFSSVVMQEEDRCPILRLIPFLPTPSPVRMSG